MAKRCPSKVKDLPGQGCLDGTSVANKPLPKMEPNYKRAPKPKEKRRVFNLKKVPGMGYQVFPDNEFVELEPRKCAGAGEKGGP